MNKKVVNNVERDVIFLYFIALICIIFILIEGISLIRMKGKTAETIGIITDIKTALPESVKRNNSKWAIISYNVDGKIYMSSNRIQVPMSSEVGNKVKVCYCINQPAKIYSRSLTRLAIAFIVAIVCVIVANIKQL